MPHHAGDVEAYRAWAAQQERLELFARPAWLDAVAPDRWRAEVLTDAKGRCRRAWAYVPRGRFGLRYATLPPATPYLGPSWPSGHVDASERPPAGLGYAVFTVRDPAAAWRFGGACRAMATQVIDLRRRGTYDTDLRRRLRRGAEALTAARVGDIGELESLRGLIQDRPEALPLHWVPHYAKALGHRLARAYTVHARDRSLQAMAIVPHDGETAYLTVQVRARDAHPATTTVLIDHIIDDIYAAGISRLDMESGYLPGVRDFHARFGARPEWYGQVRLSGGPGWRLLDGLRALTNPKRL